MAQALFDEHPLEEYLRGAGESLVSIPGTTTELERELDPNFEFLDDSFDGSVPDWRPPYLLEFIEVFQSLLSAHSPSTSNPFVERFKYNVISSSLLAPSLPAPYPKRPSRTSLSIPGRLHSRTPSVELEHSASSSLTSPSDPSYGPISFAILSFAVFFSIGYPFLAFLSFLTTIFLLYQVLYMTETPKHDMTSSFNALDDLIAANEMWESVVQDAVTVLDKEEHNLLHSTSGSSPPSPIRVALHSCLQGAHTQSDNIRHLFSALTSPADLSQLSEMYAPPSPILSGFALETSSRPFSFPSPRLQSTVLHTPTTPENKRSTWNGSYSSLAYAGSPTSSLLRRRDKRDKHRVNLSDVFKPGTSSAPTTPSLHNPLSPLHEIPEHSKSDEPASSTSQSFSPLPSHFGAAALDLKRKQKSGGMEAFRESNNYFASDIRSPRSARNNMFSPTMSSKFTSPLPARHPLSYAALTGSLQAALAAKRYACSHLLALRFADDDDEGYWEDVRSVMGLLTGALTDGFSRLSEALDEVEEQNLRDQNPTPDTSISLQPEADDVKVEVSEQESNTRRKHGGDISFAPMPSHVSRFAAHVAAISSALDDARDDLEQCVDALKSDSAPSNTSGSSRRLRHSTSFSRAVSSAANQDAEEEEPRALQAYERLRRELGVALRECERGRERLLELVYPPLILSDEEEEFDDLPSLGHDGSDDSDKPDPNIPSSEDEADLSTNAARLATSVVNNESGEGAPVDDASPHLLLATSSLHLPRPGIEEVFEADTGAKVLFSREKSKLSREERIKLAKARRESGLGLANGVSASDGAEPVKMSMEKWGPGGEVVQELKDVIWKVSERKRKMTGHPQADAAPSPLESS
ncbi:hypothetical protein GALMADRAFT_91528 [Galerina marginata CBS 339.88]|uniref:Uncharacterized protein n=1 Tax=Galerina marginata (strain CBS 339.88) TaxID=685588 RepID=A0A067TCH2_GALM3|nr:hypothetical protein GALMADRAFT_91528 [Galerina marginata CBS 339.88]